MKHTLTALLLSSSAIAQATITTMGSCIGSRLPPCSAPWDPIYTYLLTYSHGSYTVGGSFVVETPDLTGPLGTFFCQPPNTMLYTLALGTQTQNLPVPSIYTGSSMSCIIAVVAEAQFLASGAGGSLISFPFTVPNSSAFSGFDLYSQWIGAWNGGGTPWVSTSAVMRIHIQ